MNLKIFDSPEDLGKAAAEFCTEVLNDAIAQKGEARLVLSTGASQFDTIKNLVKAKVDWNRVEMFHLDEYVNLPESHPASFRRYLKDRFISQINLKKAYLVDGEGNAEEKLEILSTELLKKPVDLALIGIGENAHIAFNDPPADFETKKPYIIVKLNDACKRQQTGEGWFATPADVPDFAESMSVYGILQSKVILSCVPYKVKAAAVRDTVKSSITNMVPATILKTHPDWYLYLDRDSSALLEGE